MHILYITRELPPELPTAGIGTYVDAISKEMVKIGHEVTIISGTLNNKERDYIDNGRHIIRVPWKDGATIPFLSHINYLIKVSRHIDIQNRIKAVDIIEAPDYLGQSFSVFLSMTKVPVTTRLHGTLGAIGTFYAKPKSATFWLIYFLEKITLKYFTNHISAPSKFIKEFIFKNTTSDIDIDIFPNIIPLSQYKEKTRVDILLYIGRLEERKGVHHIVEIMNSFLKENPTAKIIFIGRDTIYKRKNRLMSDWILLHVSPDYVDRVRIIEPLPHVEILDWMRKSRLLLMPSLFETFGLVALEAMSVGLPSVVYSETALEEIIEDNFNGRIIQHSNIKKLNEEVSALFKNKNELDRMSKNSIIKYNREYELNKNIKKILKIYNKVSSID
jgi:glycogen synthase